MIKLNLRVMEKPVKEDTYTYYPRKFTKVPVTKIRNTSAPGCKPHNSALIHDHRNNAPHNREYPDGEVWLSFMKSENEHVKLPILKSGQEVEV